MAITTQENEDKLQEIMEIERQLNEIQDVDVLLERILTETRRIVNADAGSIYVVEEDRIKIKYGQNDSVPSFVISSESPVPSTNSSVVSSSPKKLPKPCSNGQSNPAKYSVSSWISRNY